ncbi:MAG: RNA-binding cell elongation regulator Jag/EloR [bacterium]|nr:RNA-binding cell elongation regulator Jag/EloR [bacterium]
MFPKLNKTSTEKSGKTVNDAILAALDELGVTKDDVTVDIIEEGKSGFFGIGRKDAVVRVSVKESIIEGAKNSEKDSKQTRTASKRTPSPAKQASEARTEKPAEITVLKGETRSSNKPKAPKQSTPAKEFTKPVKQNKLPPEQRSAAPKNSAEKSAAPSQNEAKKAQAKPEAIKADAAKAFAAPEARRPRKPENARRESPAKRQRPVKKAEAKPEPRPSTPKKISGIPPQEIATKFLTDIFGAMQLDVKISTEMESEDSLIVNLDGENMGIVIGKRGDTLDSLQYLTSLVINQQTENYIKVTIDTENYREKRTEALLALSNRLADKVARTGKKFTLEPMSPYERRIIHSNLQENEAVTTFSVGTEPYRKVVIAPKSQRPYKKNAGAAGRSPKKGGKRRVSKENSQDVTAEKKGSYTTTYKADFKPPMHKAEFKSFDDYLKAQDGE